MRTLWHAASLLVLLVGVLKSANLTGKVLEDHSNTPLALAAVRIVKVSTHTVIAELDTDGQGQFQSPPLKPGEYRIEISRPNFLDTSVRVWLTDSGRKVNAR